jgi:hypothetical protein
MLTGYQSLPTHNGMSDDARRLVCDQLDMQLADVHAMLRLPISGDSGLAAGCNFAAIQVLLSVASGVSVTLFKPSAQTSRCNRGKLFKVIFVQHYPWEQELAAPGRRWGHDAAKDLYDLFRNPLVHALGVVDAATNRRRWCLSIDKTPMKDNEIADLEMTPPSGDTWLEPTLVLRDRTLTLCVRSLYGGVREMIERVSRTPNACSFAFPNEHKGAS